MKLINQPVAAGLNLKHLDKNVYGIEIELENYQGRWDWDGQAKIGSKHWDLVDDPSLRHGIELVSKKLTQRQLVEALAVAGNSIKKQKLKTSTRCGIHVHINMLNLTWGQMWSFLALYTFIEPELFAKFAPERHENHFCVPMFWNTKLVSDLSRDATTMRHLNVGELPKKNPQKLSREQLIHMDAPHPNIYGNAASRRWFPAKKYLHSLGKSKYAALTTYRTNDLGTLESRMLPGTLDMTQIALWVNVLGRIKHMAAKYTEPLALQKVYESKGPSCVWDTLKVGPLPKIKGRDKDEAEECAYKIIGDPVLSQDKFDWKV